MVQGFRGVWGALGEALLVIGILAVAVGIVAGWIYLVADLWFWTWGGGRK